MDVDALPPHHHHHAQQQRQIQGNGNAKSDTEMKRGESEQQQEQGQGQGQEVTTHGGDASSRRSLMNRGDSPFTSLIRGGAGVADIGLRLDVQEDEHNMNIVAELPPSVRKSDVNINVRGNVLSITAEKRNERKEEDKDKKYLLQEISYGSTSRTIRLPNYVDMNKLHAKYDESDGKLKISVPKKEESKNTEKKIEIQ